VSKYRQTFAEAYNSIYESAAAKEIDRTNTRKDSMDYKMYKKAVDLLKSKKYDELKTFLKKSDTSPREYVMFTILMKEPKTFKKMYGNQTGYLSLMDKKAPFRISYSKQGQHAGFEDADSLQDLQNKAQKLRAKGFTIDKMGRNTSPIKEDHEVSMATGQVRVMKERLDTIMSFLSSKSDDYDIEGWVQSYITSAEESLTTVADYLDKNPDMQNEAKDEQKEVPSVSKEKKEAEPKKDTGALERTIQNLNAKLALVQQKLENEKNKVVKPEPNPETGEVPLRTGLANAILDKKVDTKELVKSKEKKEIKVGMKKTKVEVNPDVELGNFSGGMRVNSGNLH
jgi:hypothetical protein